MLGSRQVVLGFVLIVAALGASAEDGNQAEQKPSKVKVLTDDNFEHLTQSVTGATTGDWFVEFYAPWCGHCKRLDEPWNKLAEQMAEDKDAGEPVAIIAKVDATIERYLSGRFKIKGFPSLLMFSKGQMITYQGDRSYDDLLVFVKGGFRKVGGEPVPKGLRPTP
ncbi:thioredoxin-like protein [Baffinella frigidus]|nr:thioredoxin-like protein [Cryptophyta sp. CCMP2293]